ncbi:MAG: hypothetical protein M8861_00920 [marine benthic group bacterium]|nr:hypothetical protein [Gemmatimonadota bacterium]
MKIHVVVLSALLLSAPVVAAQEPAAAPDQESVQNVGPVRVFLDCRTRCDFDFIRQEIPYVAWVRDRQDAQVHLLITRQQTGAGGRENTLAFIGLQDMASVSDTLLQVSSPTDTDSEEREKLTRTIALGLIPYVARTPQAAGLNVSWTEPTEFELEAVEESDPWNSWIFRLRTSGSLGGEERTQDYSISTSVSANRTTEDVKTEIWTYGRYAESSFELSDGSTTTGLRRDYGASLLQVWSLGDHWSIGGETSAGHSLYGNYDLRAWIAPALEFSVWPYVEATRRQLTFLYALGVQHSDYIEITIFGETQETRPAQSLFAALSMNEPWGNATVGLEAFQYLHDLERHRLELFGRMNVRLFRGLDFNVSGYFARVKDQINLRAGEATDEEILLRQRELGTDFRYGFSFGLSYRFGSIFNNAVNPRFEALD